MPVILATWEAPIRKIAVQDQPRGGGGGSKTLSQKFLTQKKAGGVVQVVECLLSKCEALSSQPIITPQKKQPM
jgi:hypothetical protein